jgi:hypothetical protein
MGNECVLRSVKKSPKMGKKEKPCEINPFTMLRIVFPLLNEVCFSKDPK